MAGLDQNALLTLLSKARKRIETLERDGGARAPIAIIGMACRLPGADSTAAFWSNLIDGVDAVGPLRDGRWDIDALVSDAADPVPGKMRTADGGFLDDVRGFDAAFFGISGREAAYMDPQQRLLLQTCWHAFEDAGIKPADLSGTDTGVFVGISGNDYGFLQAGQKSAQEPWAGTGNALSVSANRLSYLLNLKGPSMAVDTACSSSLVALHHAVRSLRSHESAAAVVAGVNLLLNPNLTVAFSQAGMISPTGRCRTFSADADGYVRSEGVGVLILKRLDTAQRDGDRVLAIVAGSAVNQDGQGNGLTAPNGPSQVAVIRAALKDAGAAMDDLAYVEAHGTGTPLGDPIEFNALAEVIGQRSDGASVWVGAAKAAIGHTEAAAGVAGIIKTVLAMQAGQIPAQLHLADLNPRLRSGTSLAPVRQVTDWPPDRPLAGVSSFGFGGTNAHVVLARADAFVPDAFDGPAHSILCLTARSEAALQRLAERVAKAPPDNPCDFAASLARARTGHPYRLAVPVDADAPLSLVAALHAYAAQEPGRYATGKRKGSRTPRLVFAFTGQGSQRAGMGQALYTTFPAFRRAFDAAAGMLAPHLDVPLAELVFGADDARLAQTRYTQPSIVALQYAICALLSDWGITPDAVMGYSLGEYTAAMVAGALAPEVALPLVAQRGALIQSLPAGGAMLSLRAPDHWIAEQIAGHEDSVAVAARIAEGSCVISGDAALLDHIASRAQKNSFQARSLHVSHAFHAPLLDPILPGLRALCDAVPLGPLDRPLISNLGGVVHGPGARLGSDHWVRHTREAVDFASMMAELARDPATIVLEIGPNGTICAMGRGLDGLEADRFVPALTGRADDATALMDAVAAVTALGRDLDGALLGKGTLGGFDLPLYPFDSTPYWIIEDRPKSPVGFDLPHLPDGAAPPELQQLMLRQLDLVRQTIDTQLDALAASGLTGPVLQIRPAPAAAGPAPMRPAAQVLWMLAQKSDNASRAYHIPVLLSLTGAVDVARLETAVGRLFARHDALRACYPLADVIAVRDVDQIDTIVQHVDARSWTQEARDLWIAARGEQIFDLTADTLLRVALMRRGDDDWLLSIEAHHLVTDGLSMNIFVGELAAYYNEPDLVLDPAPSYLTYLHRLAAERQSPSAIAAGAYWVQKLAGGAPALDLLTDRPRGAVRSHEGGRVLEVFDAALNTRLRQAARDLNLTPFMLLYAVFAATLGRLAGQDRVAMAIPTAGRGPDMQGVHGYCSDLMFAICDVDLDGTLAAHCAQARVNLLQDFAHQAYSFAWLAEDLRDKGQTLPLQVVFNYQNAYIDAAFDGLATQVQPRPMRYIDAEWTLNAVDVAGHLALELNFDRDLYDAATAGMLLAALTASLRAVADDTTGLIADLPLIGDKALAALRTQGKGEVVPMPDAPVHAMIEAVAARQPDAPALRHGAQTCTYAALNRRANILAHHLLAQGVGPEMPVGIYLARSIDLIVAQLAVLKAGGAFVYLDQTQPVARLRDIMAQADLRHIIGTGAEVLRMEAPLTLYAPDPAEVISVENPGVTVAPDQLMYLIFTSGSTGTPKGVMIEHRTVGNYVGWLGRTLDVTPQDVFLQFSSLGFDASIEEIYTALTHGAALVLREDDLPSGAAAFWADIAAKEVTILDLPTAFWHNLMWEPVALAQIPRRLRHVILGGEAAKPQNVQLWRDKAPAQVGLWNTYGPTETTIVCTTVRLNDLAGDGPTPIGLPVANAEALVLDEALKPVPVGVIGGLYIGGQTLARGYLGRDDLTDAAFVTLPGAVGRYYRTQDLVRWRPDGLLEYHGRADTQIKVRGFRVEAGEIEKAIEAVDGVTEAVVVAADVSGTTRLAAYLVTAGDAAPDAGMLRTLLRESLADYMVPQAFVMLDALPLNRNGKVDRKALPPVDWTAALTAVARPQVVALQAEVASSGALTADEARLGAIWAEVLGLDPAALTPESDFFAIGGDSLTGMRVLSLVQSREGFAMKARDLFRSSRLGDLARVMAGAVVAAPIVIPRLDRSGPLPLSSGQMRLWFLHHLDPASGSYNLPSRIDMRGPLVMARVDRALRAIVARHEALRTTLTEVDGTASALIAPTGDLPLEVVDLRAAHDPEAALQDHLRAMSVAPFDLNGGPLVRAALYRMGAHHHCLLMCAHHIITDGWSMAVLARDFARAYEGDPLPALDVQHVDLAAYALAARAAQDTGPLLDFWRGSLADLPELLELPTDYPRPDRPDGQGRVHFFDLTPDEAAAVRDGARRMGVTPFAVLQSAFGLLLARLSGQGAFAIGTVQANRSLPGAEEVIGFFADTLALRFDAADQPSFAALAARQQQVLLDAMAQSSLPFETIVEDLVTERNDRFAPIFQTMFVWQNTPAQATRAGDLTLESARLDKGATQFDLVLDMTEGPDGISAMLEYRTQLFAPATIARFADQFRAVLRRALAQPDAPVGAWSFFATPDPAPPVPLALDDLRVDAILDAHAATRPDAPALVFAAADGSSVTLTWAALHEQAAAMADVLAARGIGHGDAVAICAERCPGLMVAIYAVMKAGGVYVPLDPASPAERQQALLASAGARLLLTQEPLLPLFGPEGAVPAVPYLFVDQPLPKAARAHVPARDPGLPIYMIFTSGTTGTPKGVVVPHRGVANMARGMGHQLGVGPDDSLLQFAPLNFDASALQIFVPLLAGGTAIFHHAPGRLGAGDFMQLADRFGLTILDLPAALWRQWVDTMTEEGMRMAQSIRIFLTGGEALNARTMRKWAALCDRKVTFLSSYGPTEASITATAYVSDSDAMARLGDVSPDIGAPLPNVGVHVLDLYGAPAAPGVIGEIAISGPGVATGYLDDPERTATAFRDHPLFGRIYLTGDYGRQTPAGSFEFHGRRDAQIKIRGFRVEPAEIEAVLLSHPQIAQALVTTRQSEDRRTQLVAYAVGFGGETDAPSDLRAFMDARLAGHMVPAAVQMLSAFPLLPNGKINRKILPPVDLVALRGQSFAPPATEAEIALARIWQDLLRLDAVGRHDNFFELGGDSILSLQLAAQARRAGFILEVRDVFQHQTLAGLAGAARFGPALLAEQGRVSGPVAMVPQQATLMGLRLPFDAVTLTAPATVSEARLRDAVGRLALHHDILRARFSEADGLVIAADLPDGTWLAAGAPVAGDLLFHAVLDAGHLQLLAHPALLDQTGWQIVVTDLIRLVDDPDSLPPKTTAVVQVAEAGLFVDLDVPLYSGTEHIEHRHPLDPALRDLLARGVLDAYRLTHQDMLCLALARVLSDGSEQVLDIALSGRAGHDPRIDLHRTAGRFAMAQRMAFDPGKGGDVQAALLAVKDRIRLGPLATTGGGDFLVRDDIPAPPDVPGWQIGALPSQTMTDHLLCLGFDPRDGSLVLAFDEEGLSAADVAALGDAIAAELAVLLAHCASAGAGCLSLSDVPHATVTLPDLIALGPDVASVHDASFGQAGMVFHARLSPETGAFMLHTVIHFDAGLDVIALRAACADLVARHGALRSGFLWDDRPHPLVVVRKSADLPWAEVVLDSGADEDAVLRGMIAADRVRPLDLGVPPLMRLTLVRRKTGHTLMWLKHHAVLDGWSMPLLYDDLVAFYQARVSGGAAQLPAAPDYADYIGWLRDWDRDSAVQHWAARLSDFDTPTDIGIGRGAAAENGQVAIAARTIPAAAFSALQDRAKAEKVTISTLIQGVWAVLLARCSGQSDVAFGVTVAGRPADLPGADKTVGMFLNALPMRSLVTHEAPVWAWLRDQQARHLENDAHGHLSLLDMQRQSGVPAGERLIETMVIFQNTPLGEVMTGGFGDAARGALQQHVTGIAGFQKSNYPLTLFAQGEAGDLALSLNYDPGRFDADQMEAMLDHVQTMLAGLGTSVRLGDLRLMTPAQEAAVQARAAGPVVPRAQDGSLLALFDVQLARRPEALALFTPQDRLSYAELDALAGRIAGALQARGVGRGDVVAILAERSLHSTAALLGIMKAGAAFLALDPAYPPARLRFMLADSGAVALVHGPQVAAEVAGVAPQALALSDAVQHPGGPRHDPRLAPDDLAYLIYTSGSTGEPKGVRALHRGALNRLHWMWDEMPFAPGEVMVQKTALSFVDSIWEVFGPLLRGVPSLVLDGASVRDVPAFVGFLAAHRVSRLVLVPTLLRAMLDLHGDLGRRLPALQHWICSGETLSGDLVRDFRAAMPDARLLNLYGSSEVAADVTWFDTAEMGDDPDRPASLGRPIDNTSVYILDAALALVPDGLPGEVYIGGENLADGYHCKPELTAEAFVPNPFGTGRLFRSRDWARRAADGTLTFLGRQDGQIKIRGMRVELAEIETVFRSLEGVTMAVVVNRPGHDKRARIAGYYTGSLTDDAARTALEARLPGHMVPGVLTRMDALPLLPNGKIDRRALPDPDPAASGGQITAPEGATETVLAQIWADVLGRDVAGIGREQNYFRLGGDSISCLQVVARASAQGLKLDVRDMFQTQTLAELAMRTGGIAPAVRKVALGRDFPAVALGDYRTLSLPVTAGGPQIDALLPTLMQRHPWLAARIVIADGDWHLVTAQAAPDALPLFEMAQDQDRFVLRGHPLLVTPDAWQQVLADLSALTTDAALAGLPVPMAPDIAPVDQPLLREEPQTRHLQGPAGACVQDLVARQLKASPEEAFAAAIVHALAPDDRRLAWRRAGQGRDSLVGLPRGSGDLMADLRAVKAAMRRPPEAGVADLTFGLFGGPGFAAATSEPPVAFLTADAAPHLGFDLLGEAMAAHGYRDGGLDDAAYARILAALDALAGDMQAPDQAWIASDFPQNDLALSEVSTIARRYPRLENVQRMTPGQTGMIHHALLDPDSAVYALHMRLELAQAPDEAALGRAFTALIARHEVLRTVFVDGFGKQPVQVVLDQVQMHVTVVDLSHLEDDGPAFAEVLAQDRAKAVPVHAAPLMRATLVRRASGEADLLWVAHHAVTDGWSLPILFRELMVLYDHALGRQAETLPTPARFADYLRWIAAKDRKAALAHWQDALGQVTKGTDLVIGRGIAAESGRFASETVGLDAALVGSLAARAQTEGVTLNTVAQAAWAALLARYNQEEAQIFGVTVSGRPADLPGIEAAVGPFVNVLPMHVPTDDAAPLGAWLRQVQQIHAANDAHNQVSFADMQSQSRLPPGERLCDSMIVYQNFPVDERLVAGMRGAAGPALAGLLRGIEGHQTTSYALTLFVIPAEAGAVIELLYDAGRFDPAEIRAMARHLVRIFEGMATAQVLGDLDILNAAEEQELIALGQGDMARGPQMPLMARFDGLVQTGPDRPALITDGEAVSFGALNLLAERLAAHLQARGIGAGDVVALHLDRSVASVAAMLAVMKAGGVWLALDPHYPPDRLGYMLEDSGAKLVLRDAGALAFAPGCPVLAVQALLAEAPATPVRTVLRKGSDLAYLIYTSGSTGRPKGVRATHAGLINRLEWMWHALPFQAGEVGVIKTAQSFVDSVVELFGPLLAGTPSVICTHDEVVDTNRFIGKLAEHKVSRLVLVPSLLRAMLDMPGHLGARLPSLKIWIISGEACTAELVLRFRSAMSDARLLNIYGSSEVAGDVTWCDTSTMDLDDPSAPVPIGRPMDANQVYVLDRRRRLTPRHLPGELYVGGIHLADGYHAQPELTAAAFVANPFGEGALFHTRDWARWTDMGLLAFLGRQDGQVKIRGMRVELGEVESVLRSQPGVDDGVVKPVPGPGGTLRLAAYWSGSADEAALRAGVARQLASHMVPQSWMRLDALPLLPNGKINRRALPDPVGPGKAMAQGDPSPLLLGRLRPLWAALLDLTEDDVPDDTDFFALGGHSLVAARAIAEIDQRIGVAVPMRQFFEASSLADIAQRLEQDLIGDVPPDELAVLIAQTRQEAGMT